YRAASRIFMSGEGDFFQLLSREGTTQGCPLAMAMYALALVPLGKSRPAVNKSGTQTMQPGVTPFHACTSGTNACAPEGPDMVIISSLQAVFLSLNLDMKLTPIVCLEVRVWKSALMGQKTTVQSLTPKALATLVQQLVPRRRWTFLSRSVSGLSA